MAESDADGAIKLVEQVIADAAPEEAELHARAYNALGACYQKKPDAAKDALLAYLHVDVLYNTLPEEHAEALFHLANLWDKVGNAEEARRARANLTERYPGSVWAGQAAKRG